MKSNKELKFKTFIEYKRYFFPKDAKIEEIKLDKINFTAVKLANDRINKIKELLIK
jgi:hypothetical protein